jgi:hypothetical protein
MSLTTDPSDPRLGHGESKERVPQNAAHLVLPEGERVAAKFIRPVRESYKHVGLAVPTGLRDLTDEEKERHAQWNYVKFQPNPNHGENDPVLGTYWTQERLDKAAAGGCNTVTTMPLAIAETYARNPKYYGSTYCCGCSKYIRVEEFVWAGTDERVGS